MAKARSTRQQQRFDRRELRRASVPETREMKIASSRFVFTPQGPRQHLFVSTIMEKTLTFAIGCAGSGKTFVALAIAKQLFEQREIRQIILTRPFFEIDEKLGTLPGDKDEKVAQIFRPLRSILNQMWGSSQVTEMIKNGKIVLEPLGGVLGNTYDSAFIILDEAQNTTPGQMKALLTRTGKFSKVVVCGDYKEQKFLEGRCGLEDALHRLLPLHSVGMVEFTPDDIVRSAFCKEVILAYRNT